MPPRRKRSPWQIEHNGVLYRRVEHLQPSPIRRWGRWFGRVVRNPLVMLAGLFIAVIVLKMFTFESGDSEWRASNAFQVVPRNCASARALGLDNARRGQAGYASHLDADGDGIACEPYYGKRRW